MLQEYRNHLLSSNHTTRTAKLRTWQIQHLTRQHPDLLTVTREDLEAILASMHEAGMSSESRKSTRSAYKSFFGWLEESGHRADNPAAKLGAVRVWAKMPRIAPDDIVQDAITHAPSREQLMILLARLACLRLSELTNLHMHDRHGDALHILGKGEKERVVYANDDLMRALLAREHELGPDTYYFPGRYGGAMHPMSVNKVMTRATGLNPHSLRHAGATAAYRATRDLRAVQVMLGHSSLATTERYLHFDENSQRAAAAGTAFQVAR